MPSLLNSPPQLPSTCGWGHLYPVDETAKPRQLLILPAAAAKKPAAYSGGGKKKNLETCTEALGCETGGVDGCDSGVEAENVERKRRAREVLVEEEEGMTTEESSSQSARRGRLPLPPPLTTLALGVNRVRMVHERRDGRLEVHAVPSPGILEAERTDGRLRLRLLPLVCGPDNDGTAMCCRQEPEEEEEEAKEAAAYDDEMYAFAKYVRGGRRCVNREGGAAVVTEQQAAAFWVATS